MALRWAGIACLCALAWAGRAAAMADMASSGDTPDEGQCLNSMGEDCALARSWFYKPPVFSLADTAAAAVAAMSTRSVSQQQMGRCDPAADCCRGAAAALRAEQAAGVLWDMRR